MKLLTQIGAVVILVGFPLISWLYLDYGLDFRKKMIQSLEPKSEISAFNIHIDSTNVLSEDDYARFTTLTCFVQDLDHQYALFLKAISSELKDRDDFKLLLFHSEKNVCSLVQESNLDCFRMNRDLMDSLKSSTFHLPKEMKGNAVILTDTSLQIRQYYDLKFAKMEDIFEQLVFILPSLPEKNVAIKQ